MPSPSADDIARRRTRVAYLLLTGVPRAEVAERVGLPKRTVARDIAAIARAVGHRSGGNRDALEETIGALRDAGRLERVDNAKLAILRSLASQLDLDTTNSQMFRVYWDALDALTDDDDDDGTVADVLTELFGAVRDEETPRT